MDYRCRRRKGHVLYSLTKASKIRRASRSRLNGLIRFYEKDGTKYATIPATSKWDLVGSFSTTTRRTSGLSRDATC